MTTFSSSPAIRSVNAKVGAVALALSAFLTLLLTHVSATVAPLRLIALAASQPR